MAILLLRYSEIGLKGISVRNRWENRLKDNILQMLAADGVEALVTRGQARFYVEASDLDAAIRSIRKVFGVGSISIAETFANDMETICSTVAEYSKSRMVKGKTFAVKARREGGQKYTSMDLAKSCGDAIWNANLDKDPKVNLKDPDIVFWVESRPRDAFIFQDYIYCHAGLPMGSQGHVLAYVDNDRGVLSALLMMKRGCKVVVRGEYGLDLLREYDPNLKVVDDNYITAGRVLGFVKGFGLDDIEGFEPSEYALPVFFPTVGMSDSEVEERLEVYRKEASESPRRR
ncbi:MAG: THUMP domain-containing protein [Methanomethylophilus sp.]|nr:THUMP domain-containing protein [Methanomethylophilus sp.]